MNLDVLPSVQRDKHPNYLVLYSFRPKKKPNLVWDGLFLGRREYFICWYWFWIFTNIYLDMFYFWKSSLQAA